MYVTEEVNLLACAHFDPSVVCVVHTLKVRSMVKCSLIQVLKNSTRIKVRLFKSTIKVRLCTSDIFPTCYL